jgi:ABC-type Fe3+/spermidine/putrescine transport system ATPase subunit
VRDGAAAEVWSDPGSAFVARFLGHANVLGVADAQALGLDVATPVVVSEAALALGSSGRSAAVVDVRFRGATSRVVLDVAGVPLSLHSSDPPPVAATVGLTIDPTHVHPLTAD